MSFKENDGPFCQMSTFMNDLIIDDKMINVLYHMRESKNSQSVAPAAI